ncbi:importin subunit alpha-4-like [Vicia villosa]|uniref:importin subunit alpha-4-like n=1 Tax=Vicia villosa TaxID=3911 RepID=UPI00273AA565|nr:importin subunit alpha-4-like [Vicia villosa]
MEKPKTLEPESSKVNERKDEPTTKHWVDVISNNKNSANDLSLEFVAPKIVDGEVEIKTEHEDIASEKDEISEIPGWLISDELDKQREATKRLNMLVEQGETSVIQEVVKQNAVVPYLINLLANGNTYEQRLLAAQCLANIARGNEEQTMVIIDQHAAIPPLVYSLETGRDDIKEMAILALSNISGHSTTTRDAVVKSGAFEGLWKLLKNPLEPRLTILKQASLALSVFCRGDPPSLEVFDKIRLNMFVLKQLLMMRTDKEVTKNACITFSLIASKGSPDMIQAVDSARICPRLIGLIKLPMPECFEPALLTLAKIAAQSHDYAQRVIEGGDLDWLQSFFTEENNINIVTQALRLISNLTRTAVQIQAVIAAGLVNALVNSTMAESEFRKDAAEAILNITSNGSPEQILSLVNGGCIPPLCDLLTCADPMIVCTCLNGLKNILNADQAYKGMVEGCGGKEKIASLQHNDNLDARDIAVEILEGFWQEMIDYTQYFDFD